MAKKEEKPDTIKQLFGYAGNYRYLTIASWVLATISAFVALVPFYFIWRLIKEVLRVAPDYGNAQNLSVYGVKTLKLDIPLVPEPRINWAFVPLHIAIIYILKLCLDEEIIPRCRFPCSRGYLIKCINWQKKQSFSVRLILWQKSKNWQKEKMNMAYKKYREMKVYEASGYQYKRTPSIVLKGKWLSDLGFDIGEQIEVKCEDGRLVITKANEIWMTE